MRPFASYKSLVYSKTEMYEKTLKIKKQKDATVEIKGEIPADILERHRGYIFEEFRAHAETPGFRKGRVPEHIAREQIDEKYLLEEAAYTALEEQYPLILEESNIDPITSPRISVTKLAFGSPIEFTISVGTEPEFSLPNYKKIAKKVFENRKEPDVTEKEIEEVITQIRIMRSPVKNAEKDGEMEAEELTDEFVKTLGAFENVDDFKKKIRENLLEEKRISQKREYREKIAHALVENTKMVLPPMLIEDEFEQLMQNVDDQLKKNETTREEYFSKIKKSEEEFEKEQRSYIERQYKTKFILEKIAEEEHISSSKEEIEGELADFLAYHKDADPDHAEEHLSEIMRNEKTLVFLESFGEEEKK